MLQMAMGQRLGVFLFIGSEASVSPPVASARSVVTYLSRTGEQVIVETHRALGNLCVTGTIVRSATCSEGIGLRSILGSIMRFWHSEFANERSGKFKRTYCLGAFSHAIKE